MEFEVQALETMWVTPRKDSPLSKVPPEELGRGESPRMKGTKRKNEDQVKASAPKLPTTAPDLDKLCRSIGDALAGICYLNDSQIVDLHVSKFYGESFRTEILIEDLNG